METTAVLSASQLSIGYSAKKGMNVIHAGLSFSLNRGEVTSLLGVNGAGKSTLLRTLSAVQPALGGELQLLGQPLFSYSDQERSRLLGVVLTERILAGGLMVGELVSLGRQPHTGFFGRLNREDIRIVDEALVSVGMDHKKKNYVAELSDGERQKVMIAKVLAQECPVILLDEPTAFLDVTSRIEMMNLLHRIASEQQKSILLSTHDLEQAFLLSDRIWILSREEFRCGVPEDVVFSGVLEQNFCRNGVFFDRLSGMFRPEAGYSRRAHVQAPADAVYWIRNLLERNRISCTDSPEKADLFIEIFHPGRIVVSSVSRRQPEVLSSFSELTGYLHREE